MDGLAKICMRYSIFSLISLMERDMGEAIRRLRERHGWTIAELAGRVGMSSSAVGKRETGDTRVKPNEYRVFADVFGITEADLERAAAAAARGLDLEGDDGRVQSADLLQIFVGPLGSAVVQIFANNSPMDAKLLMDRLIAYAEGLAATPRLEQGGRLIEVVGEPKQRDGYVEQTMVTYEDRRHLEGESNRANADDDLEGRRSG